MTDTAARSFLISLNDRIADHHQTRDSREVGSQDRLIHAAKAAALEDVLREFERLYLYGRTDGAGHAE